MKSPNLASESIETVEAEDIFFMTNLSPRMTGLPMSIWANPRGHARHDVRIKVNMSHGRQMNIDNTACCRCPTGAVRRRRPPQFGGSALGRRVDCLEHSGAYRFLG
jgi:hypothetical protein